MLVVNSTSKNGYLPPHNPNLSGLKESALWTSGMTMAFSAMAILELGLSLMTDTAAARIQAQKP